ncbi:hypothetical protein [Chitinophaga sp.]|uniref:hypothetical protein n=1 Tax=Chitinophaga sp. TaxID=1869181 RepID=UPI002F924347
MKKFLSTPLGLVLSFLFFILVIYYLVNKFNQEKINVVTGLLGAAGAIVGIGAVIINWITNNRTSIYEESARTPQISFSLHERGIEMGDRFSDSVKIVNISNVAALGISVRFRMSRDEEYCDWISCFDLKAQEIQELFWLRLPDSIQASYKDRTGHHYYLTTYQDRKPEHYPITEQTFQEYDAAAMANRFRNHSALLHKFKQFVQQKLAERNNNIQTAIDEYGEFYLREIIS